MSSNNRFLGITWVARGKMGITTVSNGATIDFWELHGLQVIDAARLAEALRQQSIFGNYMGCKII